MEDVLQYHINETNQNFRDIRNDLKSINEKLDAVNEFKISTVITARWVSLIISSVCGLITLVATGVVDYFIRKGN